MSIGTAVTRLFVHRCFGKYGHKAALTHHFEQYVGVVQLYLYIQVAAVGLEYLFESVAGLQSARGQCKAVMRQFVECHLGFRGQLMIAVHNRGQIVLKQCMRHYAGMGCDGLKANTKSIWRSRSMAISSAMGL